MVCACMSFRVGWRNDSPTRRGSSRVASRLMFDGTPRVPAGQLSARVANVGGVTSRHVSDEVTHLCSVVPSSALAMVLWLEADRLMHLQITEAALQREIAWLHQQRIATVANTAYAGGSLRLRQLLFGEASPLAHTGLGSESSLAAIGPTDVQRFHAMHFAASNAALTLVGNFAVLETLQTIHDYFGSASARTIAREAPAGEIARERRSASVSDGTAFSMGLLVGWLGPSRRGEEYAPLAVATELLVGAGDGLLPRSLIYEEAMARSVQARLTGLSDTGWLELKLALDEVADPDLVRRMLHYSLEQFATNAPPSSAEVAGAADRIRARWLSRMSDPAERARHLAELELLEGDARKLNGEMARYSAVDAEDVRRAVRRYLGEGASRHVVVLPMGMSARRSGEGRRQVGSKPAEVGAP